MYINNNYYFLYLLIWYTFFKDNTILLKKNSIIPSFHGFPLPFLYIPFNINKKLLTYTITIKKN